MHGTACWFCLPVLSRGGTVVTLTSPSLDAVELLDTVVARGVRRLCIVGDAFAKPILRELDADPDRWDLSALRVIFSSGAMLSQDSKHRLLRFAPKAQVFDGLGSSESGNLAMSVTSTEHEGGDGDGSRSSPNTRVVDDAGRDVVPGSGQVGRLAIGGYLPLGYYGDPEKTAATFVVLDGRRYVIAGDWAKVDADGAITLLGRGSSCINTAGEKVYPEEVEEVLKQAAGVRDAAVVGVPDERFGERVVALVEPEAGRRPRRAGADRPRQGAPRLVQGAAARARRSTPLGRGPNGKLDHRRLRETAVQRASTCRRGDDAASRLVVRDPPADRRRRRCGATVRRRHRRRRPHVPRCSALLEPDHVRSWVDDDHAARPRSPSTATASPDWPACGPEPAGRATSGCCASSSAWPTVAVASARPSSTASCAWLRSAA